MKIFIAISTMFYLVSCSSSPQVGQFGAPFEKSNVVNYTDAMNAYNSGKDTIYQIEGEIGAVCQHGACWLNLTSDSQTLKVDTKESFTLPKEGKGKKAIVNGKFVKKDDGKLMFLTTGVIVE